jgi:aminopeptidase N
MKRSLLPLLLVFSLQSQAQKIDVLNYNYEIELNDQNDTLYGKATISLKLTAASSQVILDLQSLNTKGKGMIVTGITARNKVTYHHNNNFIFIDGNYKANETLNFLIQYKGIPADGMVISRNKFGHRSFFADNWPNRAHNWIPCNDIPGDKASVRFAVTAPSHYQVVSNGLQVEETTLPGDKKLTVYEETMPIPTKVMVIAAADFAVNLAGMYNDCIPVTSWVFPENKKEGFYDYGEAPGILAWLSNYIGPYPYKKLANIQSKTIFGGMENASAIFYFENSVTGKKEQETLLAHEITHQWFGNTATEKTFAHLWLSEGFATYMTHLFVESKYGKDSLNKRMQNERTQVINFVNNSHRPVVDNTTDYMSLLNDNSYQKGGWVLHMLRRELGDSVFKKAVRSYYAAFAWKNAEVFESVSGKNLSVFFEQWLTRGYDPKIKLSWQYLAKEQALSVTVEQLSEEPFSFPLEINTGSKTEKIMVTKRSELFRIPSKNKIDRIIVDPNTSLLAEILTEPSK